MTYIPQNPPPSDQPNFDLNSEVKADNGKEPGTVSIPTPSATAATRSSDAKHHPQSVKIEDVSFAFVNLPKGVRNFFYSKSISQFDGKKITSEELLVKLPAVNYKTIHPESFACLNTPGKIQELDNNQLDGLTPECLAHFSEKALESLSYSQARYLLENKIDCFDCPKKISILILRCSDNEYRFLIENASIQSVESTVLFLDNQPFEQVSQNAVQSIPPSVIKRNPNNIKTLGDSIEYMSKDQFKVISEAHVKAMTSSQAVRYASINKETLPKDQIPALLQKIPVSPELTSLRERLLERYYEGNSHVNKETIKLDLKYLSPDTIRQLPENFIKKLIQKKEIGNLSPLLLKLIGLEKPSIIGSLGNSDLSKMSAGQLQNMLISIPKKILDHMDNKKYIIARSLLDSQIGTLSSEQLKEYINNGVFQEFTKGQVAYAYPALLSTLKTAEIEKISLTHLKWMSREQIQGFNASEIKGLSSNKLIEIFARHNDMNYDQLQALYGALYSSKDIDSAQKEAMLSEIKAKVTRFRQVKK